MRVETSDAIYEDSFNQLTPKVSGEKVVYECGCGEKYCYNMEIFSRPGTTAYQYNFTCGCGNRIRVYVKEHYKEL